MVDGLLDEVVGQVRAAATGRHDTLGALVAFDRVLVEGFLALSQARRP